MEMGRTRSIGSQMRVRNRHKHAVVIHCKVKTTAKTSGDSAGGNNMNSIFINIQEDF